MSYCNFNNAFQNINNKFLETFDGITSEDLYFEDKNQNNNKYQNLINSEEDKIILNGTSINNLSDNPKLNNNPKLTHRECIHHYLNPYNLKNPNYQVAIKHINNCHLCKNEINKIKNESFELVNTSTQLNQVSVSNVSSTNQSNTSNQSNNTSSNNSNNTVTLSINDLEILLKNITEKNKQNDNHEHFSRMYNTFENQKYFDSNKPFCIEINFLNIAVCLLIILLLIDIVLRIKN